MRGILALAILLPALLAALTTSPRPAFACSIAEFDFRAEADVIVEGRVSSWEVTRNVAGRGPFTAVRITLDPVVVHKGDPVSRLEFIEPASYGESGDSWFGGPSCGAFSHDPLGKYVVLGLARSPGGHLESTLPFVLFVGDEPDGSQYDRAQVILAGDEAPRDPNEVQAGAPNWPLLALAATLGAAGIALVGTNLLARRHFQLLSSTF